MTRNTKLWAGGVIQAFLSGALGVVGTELIVDLGDIWHKAQVGFVLGLIGLAQYLVKKPLPDIDDPAWSPAQSPIRQLMNKDESGSRK